MVKGLTRRQAQILDFIIDRIRSDGMPPTIAEIGQRFGITSTNGVNDHLVALEKKGFITRSSKARCIRVTDRATAGLYESQVTMVPLVGRIAAGVPVLAVENIETYIPMQPGQAENGCYALRVTGESMIEAGILDGDIIIVDPGIRPKSGSVVVALVDDEATVKYYIPRGEMLELRPANAAMQPFLVPAQSVKIQGVVVALQRSLR